MTELTPENESAIHTAIYAGQKLEAIKLYRTATGQDLKDSKDAVEKMTDLLKAQNPDRFARQPKWDKSSIPWFFWGALAALVVYYLLELK